MTASETFKRLPAGMYACKRSLNGPFLTEMNTAIDELLELPDPAMDSILDEFRDFWLRESEFCKRGYVFKRGYLFYGPPGTGKTSLINRLVRHTIEKSDGVVIEVKSSHDAKMCMRMIREAEPDRGIVAVMEDFDSLIDDDYGDETGFLSLMDGQDSINKVVYLATTNNKDAIPARFIDRPSRFDTLKYIGAPGAATRRAYLLSKEPSLVDTGEIDRWVAASENFSLAQLKEIIIGVKCFGLNFDSVIARLNANKIEPLQLVEAA
jgi:chaperone BCS1